MSPTLGARSRAVTFVSARVARGTDPEVPSLVSTRAHIRVGASVDGASQEGRQLWCGLQPKRRTGSKALGRRAVLEDELGHRGVSLGRSELDRETSMPRAAELYHAARLGEQVGNV